MIFASTVYYVSLAEVLNVVPCHQIHNFCSKKKKKKKFILGGISGFSTNQVLLSSEFVAYFKKTVFSELFGFGVGVVEKGWCAYVI